MKGWLSNVTLTKDGEVPNETGEPGMELLQGSVEEKVLGTVWNHCDDVFGFKVNSPEINILTKRCILSQVAQIYDPLGAAAAYLVRVKIGMQKLWLAGLQ